MGAALLRSAVNHMCGNFKIEVIDEPPHGVP